MSDFNQALFIDPDLASYDSLLQDPAGVALRAAGAGTLIESAIGDLLASWRMTDYARALPHILASAIPSATSGAAMASVPETPEVILRGIMVGMGHVVMPRRVRERLGATVRDLFAKVSQVRSALASDDANRCFERDVAWRGLLELDPFKMALAASEAQAYTSMYFAYECFLARVVEARTTKWPRPTAKIGVEIQALFGQAIWAACWTDPAIEAARHARDAYAHRGGKADHNTATFSSLLHVEGEHIRIAAFHTRELFDVLFDRTLRVAHAQRASEAHAPVAV